VPAGPWRPCQNSTVSGPSRSPPHPGRRPGPARSGPNRAVTSAQRPVPGWPGPAPPGDCGTGPTRPAGESSGRLARSRSPSRSDRSGATLAGPPTDLAGRFACPREDDHAGVRGWRRVRCPSGRSGFVYQTRPRASTPLSRTRGGRSGGRPGRARGQHHRVGARARARPDRVRPATRAPRTVLLKGLSMPRGLVLVHEPDLPEKGTELAANPVRRAWVFPWHRDRPAGSWWPAQVAPIDRTETEDLLRQPAAGLPGWGAWASPQSQVVWPDRGHPGPGGWPRSRPGFGPDGAGPGPPPGVGRAAAGPGDGRFAFWAGARHGRPARPAPVPGRCHRPGRKAAGSWSALAPVTTLEFPAPGTGIDNPAPCGTCRTAGLFIG